MSPSSKLVCAAVSLLAASAVAACTHDGIGPSGASLEETVQPQRMMALAPGQGLGDHRAGQRVAARPQMAALPPAAGGAGGVRTTSFADGFRQDIALAGAKVPLVTNGLTLVARTDSRDTLEERTPLEKPSEGAIRSEIGAALPHISMQIVERQRNNGYGPYGVALGRVGSDTRCLYMWQWIDANRLPRDAGLAGPASVRVRLCRNGTTFDEMASWMDGLVIGAHDAAPVVAEAASILPPAIDGAPGAETPSKRRAAGGKRAGLHHRHHRPTAVARRDDTSVAATDVPVMPQQGPRYLGGPVDTQPPAASAAPKFAGNLPPEAFAGPTAASSPSRSTPRP